MKYSAILYILGCVLEFEGIFLSLPCLVALLYREKNGFAYLAVMILCLAAGRLSKYFGKKDAVFYAREGFASVALSWIALSIFGALPFWLTGEMPVFTNALFETISGFTTTGASILSDVEALSQCSLFWRSFTHWIGGMGVLVFILAVLPLTGGYNMHLMKAESPGPQVGKLVPKVHTTAMILYGIYVTITVIEIFLLLIGGMPLFDALTLSFGTAGTGGFGIKNTSIAEYSPYLQGVISVFMILFGINFNVYYFILIRKAKQIFKSQEVILYLGIIAVSLIFITANIQHMFPSIVEAAHHALFQIASIMTTTGYSTVNFDLWPETSRTILLILMFIGACASSTGGGLKVSRILICIKMIRKELRAFIHPRSIKQIKMEGHAIDREVQYSVGVYIMAYCAIYFVSLLFLSFDNYDFTTNFSAVAATINNIGPGFNLVGPAENFGFFSHFSKFVLMFDMLAGRLELFPMLVLFSPRIWKK